MLGGGFLNTKQNSLTLADYGSDDGIRGPDYTYGWIQGRGSKHSLPMRSSSKGVAAARRKLDAAGRRLYDLLAELQKADGHAYFCYDKHMNAVYADQQNRLHAQEKPALIYSYSDAFVAKRVGFGGEPLRVEPRRSSGLFRSRCRVGRGPAASRWMSGVHCRSSALVNRRTTSGLAVDPARRCREMLKRFGHTAHTAYADRFITHVIDRHFDTPSALLRNVPGEDACNVGHGIEFVGFALDYLGDDADPTLIETLERILVASFDKGVHWARSDTDNFDCKW